MGEVHIGAPPSRRLSSLSSRAAQAVCARVLFRLFAKSAREKPALSSVGAASYKNDGAVNEVFAVHLSYAQRLCAANQRFLVVLGTVPGSPRLKSCECRK